jgi:hypothetical protein
MYETNKEDTQELRKSFKWNSQVIPPLILYFTQYFLNIFLGAKHSVWE